MDINLAIAGRARGGEPLTAAEIDELAATDVLSLGMLADEVRRARVGENVTFVRVHELRANDAAVPEAAGEIRLVELPETLDDAVELVRRGRRLAGERLLTGFSLADLIERTNNGWGDAASVFAALKAAGLDAIAEAPLDRLVNAREALDLSARAGLAVRCLSFQKPIGEDRAASLINIRTLASSTPIATVAPLPREQSVAVPTTGYDDVRMVALARLVLASVPNIQVDWAQYGPKLAQVALTFGANDVDRVSCVDDESLGRRRTSVEDVKRNIVAAGFTPVERT
jgi:CofH/MqnC C-terminal region